MRILGGRVWGVEEGMEIGKKAAGIDGCSRLGTNTVFQHFLYSRLQLTNFNLTSF